MKLLLPVTCVALVLLCLGADALKATPKPAKSCPRCNTDKYEPVCVRTGGTDKDPKFTTFGSECVLRTYNCEKNLNLVVKDKAECPEGSPVRLM